MKLQKKLLVFVMVLVLSLSAFAIGASADTETPEYWSESVVEGTAIAYAGLSARTTQDFAGLRSLFVVDNKIVEADKAAGHVTYGVLAYPTHNKLGKATGLVNIEMTVSVDGSAITVAEGANAVVVYDSQNRYGATGIYAEHYKDATLDRSLIAYTLSFFYENQTPAYLANAKFAFRAFYIKNDGEATYIDMPTEGGQFNISASLFEVATYVKTLPAFANNQAIKNTIAKASKETMAESFEYIPDLTGCENDAAKTAAVDGKTLTLNLKQGAYKIEIKGYRISDGANGVFGIKIKESGALFNARNHNWTAGNMQRFENTTTYHEFGFCLLPEGPTEVSLSASNIVITAFRLTLLENAPVEDTVTVWPRHENPSRYIMFRRNVKKVGADNIETVEYPCTDHENCTAHYYAPTNNYMYKWNSGVENIVLPENIADVCVIRDLTGLADEASGAHTQTFSYGLRTSDIIFIREEGTLQFVVNAPRKGKYSLLIPSGSGEGKTATCIVGGKTYTMAEGSTYQGKLPYFNGGETETGGYLTIMRNVELEQGKNIISFSAKTNFAISQIYAVLQSYTVNFTYTLAEEKHILSQQRFYPEDFNATSIDADIPCFFPYKCMTIANPDDGKNITGNTMIEVAYMHGEEKKAPTVFEEGYYKELACKECGSIGYQHTFAKLTAVPSPAPSITITTDTGHISVANVEETKATVNASVAGIYKVQMAINVGIDSTSQHYASLVNLTNNTSNINRIGDVSNHFYFIYLNTGDNTLKLTGIKGTAITLVGATLTLHDANLPEGYVYNTGKQLGNSNQTKYTYTQKLVLSGGYYNIRGMYKMGNTTNPGTMEMVLAPETGDAIVFRFDIDMKKANGEIGGSTPQAALFDPMLECVYIPAGTYVVSQEKIFANGFANVGDVYFQKLTPAD